MRSEIGGIGQKWIVRYHEPDGTPGMGMTNHYNNLPIMLRLLLDKGAKNIVIFDKTIYKEFEDEPGKIEGTYEFHSR